MTELSPRYRAMLDEAARDGAAAPADMRLCFELLALGAAIDSACAARLAPHNLSEGRFVLLVLLCAAPEGLGPHALAERAGVTRATVTGLLDGLERDGLLARRADPGDRRRLVVRLSPRGRALAETLFAEHARWIAGIFAGLTADERETFGALLRRVGAGLSRPGPQGAS